MLTPQDVAVFVLASVFHDLGMHLTPDGFGTLISGPTHPPVDHMIDDPPWRTLWEHFSAQAHRFGDAENILLFGKPESVPLPDLESTDWTENQFRLIGEFIRRHHARLAHEIAVFGFPGATGCSSYSG